MARRRKKPRLFSFARDVELSNYDRVPMEFAERRVLEAVVDAFAGICEANAVTSPALAAIARGCEHPHPLLRSAALSRLSVVCHYFHEAHDVMARLCGDADDDLRLQATGALSNCPSGMALPLLDAALRDPSWRVRKAAAQVACAVPWPELLPHVAAAEGGEHDARVKVVWALAVGHLRQLPDDDASIG